MTLTLPRLRGILSQSSRTPHSRSLLTEHGLWDQSRDERTELRTHGTIDTERRHRPTLIQFQASRYNALSVITLNMVAMKWCTSIRGQLLRAKTAPTFILPQTHPRHHHLLPHQRHRLQRRQTQRQPRNSTNVYLEMDLLAPRPLKIAEWTSRLVNDPLP